MIDLVKGTGVAAGKQVLLRVPLESDDDHLRPLDSLVSFLHVISGSPTVSHGWLVGWLACYASSPPD